MSSSTVFKMNNNQKNQHIKIISKGSYDRSTVDYSKNVVLPLQYIYIGGRKTVIINWNNTLPYCCFTVFMIK